MSLVADYNSSEDSSEDSDESPKSEDSDKEEEEVNNEPLPLPSLLKLGDGKSLEKLRERKLKENSVYSNPYARDEEHSLLIISKHAELTDTAEETAEERKFKKRQERRYHKPCTQFLKKGTCKYGETCKFSHDIPNAANNSTPNVGHTNFSPAISQTSRHHKLCTQFLKNGTCKYGEACKFSHAIPNAANNSTPNVGFTNFSPAISQTCCVDETLKKKNKNVTNICYMDAPVDVKTEVGDTDDALWEGGNLVKKRRPGLSDDIVPSKKVIKMYKDNTKIS